MKGHTIRKIMVTDLYNRESTYEERLSWAATMGHSLKTQQEIYNLQSRTELVAPAISDMNRQILKRAAMKAGLSFDGGDTAASSDGAPPNTNLSAAEASGKQKWTIQKVVDIKPKKLKRGNSDVAMAKVEWAPTWVAASCLTKVALDEARLMLPA